MRKRRLHEDFAIIVASIILSIVLVKTGTIDKALQGETFLILDAFVAGMFFTSVFTTAPAIVTLGEIAQSSEILWPVVLFGGLGALAGDYVIYRFVEDDLAEDINYMTRGKTWHRIKSIFHKKLFRRFVFFIGALIIASPLPDELGLAMMGLSEKRTSVFVPVSLLMNSLGILIIGLVARSFAGV